MKQSHKTLVLWGVLILRFLVVWQFLQGPDHKQPAAFTEFISDVHAGKVDEITIKDHEYSYHVRVGDGSKQSQQRTTIGPAADQELLATLRPDAKDAPGPKVSFEKEDSSPFWSSTLITILPLILIGLMFFLFAEAAPGRWGQSDELRPRARRACSPTRRTR